MDWTVGDLQRIGSQEVRLAQINFLATEEKKKASQRQISSLLFGWRSAWWLKKSSSQRNAGFKTIGDAMCTSCRGTGAFYFFHFSPLFVPCPAVQKWVTISLNMCIIFFGVWFHSHTRVLLFVVFVNRVKQQFARSNLPVISSPYMPVRFMGGGVAQHRHTDDNTTSTHFDFTEENYERVNKILAKYPSNFKQVCLPLCDFLCRSHILFKPCAFLYFSTSADVREHT